ncbi:DUF7256 domain-containing protein [Luteimonas abyssi]|uniref:DUF7256 domain-containing protein n=1 Tax=Luteimonas abyssi TaxID=1247514 RepID=UPI000737B9FB|nr:hypothetical protein [Luteimonas abyssi]
MLRSPGFARLRPGMPADALQAAAAAAWRPPADEDEGYMSWGTASTPSVCGARLDAQGRIGSLTVYQGFPDALTLAGTWPGMAREQALAAYPGLRDQQGDAADTFRKRGLEVLVVETSDGDTLELRLREGRVIALELARPGAVWPVRAWRERDPGLTAAYDLEVQPAREQPPAGRDAHWQHGWTYGRPPAIAPEHWPLSDHHAWPLRHAFTLHVPAQYRTQGADRVAIALFVDEQFREDLRPPSQWAALRADPDADVGLDDDDPLRRHLRARHPHRHDMTDALGSHYVLLWLSAGEFEGALASPPDLAGHPWLRDTPQPDWLAGTASIRETRDAVASHRDGLARPLAIHLREDDPNVGRPAREWDHQNVDSGYVPMFSRDPQAAALERFLDAPHHIGGTMAPIQGYPPFSARYVEFGEDFAGFNFGGGNAQLDLEQMRIDWACG